MSSITINPSTNTKQSPAGEIPVDWGCKFLREIVESTQLGGNYKSATGMEGVPVIKMGNMLRGKFDVSKFESLSVDQTVNPKDYLNKGDLLLNTRNARNLVGKVALWRGELREAVFNSNILRIQSKATIVDSEFLNYFFNSNKQLREISKRAIGTTSVAAIYWRDISSLAIPLPSLSEQRKIVELLSTWDKAIETVEALIRVKKKRKNAFKQQLLTGKEQLPGFNGKWKEISLGEILEFKPRKTSKPQRPFLSVGIRSHGKGVFLKPNFDPNAIALKELFEIKEGDLILNITFAWEGAIAIVPREANRALTSHRFLTFTCRSDKAALEYVRHIIHTKHFIFKCGLASPGGAGRNRVLRKIDFLRIKVKLPEIEEQKAIGAVLNICDEEILFLKNLLELIRYQKLGLMQQLLMGKIRILK